MDGASTGAGAQPDIVVSASSGPRYHQPPTYYLPNGPEGAQSDRRSWRFRPKLADSTVGLPVVVLNDFLNAASRSRRGHRTAEQRYWKTRTTFSRPRGPLHDRPATHDRAGPGASLADGVSVLRSCFHARLGQGSRTIERTRSQAASTRQAPESRSPRGHSAFADAAVMPGDAVM